MATAYLNEKIKIKKNQISDLGETKTEIVTNEIKATNSFIDGKQVFVKRIYVSSLPNSASGTYNINLPTNTTVQRLDGYYKHNDSPETFGLIFLSSTGAFDVGTYINSSRQLVIVSNANRTSYHGYVNIYFTYN